MNKKYDIVTKDAVLLLVTEFYKKVNADDLLAPFFRDVNWKEHLPRVTDFFVTMLLDSTAFRENPVTSHYRLPLEEKHFLRWLQLFHATLDEHFQGIKAQEAKERTTNLARIFQYHMGILPRNDKNHGQ